MVTCAAAAPPLRLLAQQREEEARRQAQEEQAEEEEEEVRARHPAGPSLPEGGCGVPGPSLGQAGLTALWGQAGLTALCAAPAPAGVPQEDSSEYETDDEDEAAGRLLKPVFVPKHARDVGWVSGRAAEGILTGEHGGALRCGRLSRVVCAQTVAEKAAVDAEEEQAVVKEKARKEARKVRSCRKGGAACRAPRCHGRGWCGTRAAVGGAATARGRSWRRLNPFRPLTLAWRGAQEETKALLAEQVAAESAAAAAAAAAKSAGADEVDTDDDEEPVQVGGLGFWPVR